MCMHGHVRVPGASPGAAAAPALLIPAAQGLEFVAGTGAFIRVRFPAASLPPLHQGEATSVTGPRPGPPVMDLFPNKFSLSPPSDFSSLRLSPFPLFLALPLPPCRLI